MRVIIVGLPYFVGKLTTQLKAQYPTDKFETLTLAKRSDRIRFCALLPFSSAVYAIGGTLPPGRAMCWARRLGRRVIMHWVGSDVTTAAKNAASGVALDADGIVHLCEVDWIQEELRAIGVPATIEALATVQVAEGPLTPMPERFTVGAYVGKGRETFYGFETLTRLAIAFPDVEFIVAGTDKCPEGVMPNLRVLGWVSDMNAFWDQCSLVLRLVEHDGLAFSVLEALARGRHVGYRYPYPSTTYVPKYEDAERLVSKLRADMAAGSLKSNESGRELVRRMFDPVVVAAALRRRFEGAL